MKDVKAVKIGKFVLKDKWRMGTIIIAIIVICAFGKAWSMRFGMLCGGRTSAKNLFKEKLSENQGDGSDMDDSDYEICDIKATSDMKAKVKYTKDGLYLMDKDGELLCGPYKLIEEEDLWLDMCRFVGDNGLIGYLSTADGQIVIDPMYTKASEMYEGSACVSEGKGIYYISETGERITEHDYADGYPFAESQGEYARVQMEDGSWAIINKQEEILLGGLDTVNKLPVVTVLGSAVRSGHAILFELSYENGVRLIKEYEEFCEISEVYWGECAIVKNEEGLYGVVGGNGDIVIAAQYLSIEWLRINSDDLNDYMMFKVQKKDGTWDSIIYWRASTNEIFHRGGIFLYLCSGGRCNQYKGNWFSHVGEFGGCFSGLSAYYVEYDVFDKKILYGKNSI